MVAILIHKGCAGFSLSLALGKGFPGDFKTIFWILLTFSFATPVGVSLGIILKNTSDIIDVVFSSLAGGTFLYIACSEVIVEEFSLPGGRWIKLLVFILGATIILLLWFLD